MASLALRAGELRLNDYYDQLQKLCERSGVDLARSPAFDRYCRYVAVCDSIRPDALFESIDRLERMPCHLPPLRQEMDWALCCGEPTEYLGSPANQRDLLSLSDLRAWNFGVDERSEQGIDFDGCPDELLGDIEVFRCRECGQHYIVFQPT